MIFDGEKKVYILSEQEYDEMFDGEAIAKLELIKVRKRLDMAKQALCEVSQLSLKDNVDISRFYDVAHYAITELNKESK